MSWVNPRSDRYVIYESLWTLGKEDLDRLEIEGRCNDQRLPERVPPLKTRLFVWQERM